MHRNSLVFQLACKILDYIITPSYIVDLPLPALLAAPDATLMVCILHVYVWAHSPSWISFFFHMIQVRGWKLYFFQFHMVVLAYFSENKLYFFISLLWYLHQQSNANIYVHLYGAQLYLMIYSFILNIVAYCSDCWSFMENL